MALDRAEVRLGTGWVLFFADIAAMDQVEPNRPGAGIRVFATDTPAPADGPALPARPIVATPRLTLPSWSDPTPDKELGYMFGDAGVTQFRIPADALAAEDWSQVTAYSDSC